MPPNIVLFVAALTVFLPLANLYPTSANVSATSNKNSAQHPTDPAMRQDRQSAFKCVFMRYGHPSSANSCMQELEVVQHGLGASVEILTKCADVLQYRSVDPAIPHDAQPVDTSTAPNLVTRDLTSLLDLSRALVPTQSFQLDHLGAPGDQTYYRILITFLDLLSTCTKLTRDKLIQWRLAESKDRNEQEFLKRLQSESPGRVVFPDTSIVNPNSGHGTLWTTGRKLPFFLPTVNANTVDIRR